MNSEHRIAELLEVKNLYFRYDEKLVLNDVSLSVHAGDLVVIGGPSGSGKSTLLRCINRLQDPERGTIFFNGEPLDSYKVVELRRRICYLQQVPLMVEGTVQDNLLMSFRFQSADGAMPPPGHALLELLEQFQLSDVSLTDDAATLSVGQKQRLAFIRALLLEPQILLLDEPTSSLDPQSREIVEQHIEWMARERGITVLMVTHLGFRAKQMQAHAYELADGSLKELTA